MKILIPVELKDGESCEGCDLASKPVRIRYDGLAYTGSNYTCLIFGDIGEILKRPVKCQEVCDV